MNETVCFICGEEIVWNNPGDPMACSDHEDEWFDEQALKRLRRGPGDCPACKGTGTARDEAAGNPQGVPYQRLKLKPGSSEVMPADEPKPACWTLEPQGVDVGGIREKYNRLMSPVHMTPLEEQNLAGFLVVQIPVLLKRIQELEQRLRIVGDPDGEEREALRARVAELERILSAERAEYAWAVQGAKALEAKVAAAKEWAENQEIQSRVAILTILNEGGTDGTV